MYFKVTFEDISLQKWLSFIVNLVIIWLPKPIADTVRLKPFPAEAVAAKALSNFSSIICEVPYRDVV